MTALGPHTALKPSGTKGMSWSIADEYESLKQRLEKPIQTALPKDVRI